MTSDSEVGKGAKGKKGATRKTRGRPPRNVSGVDSLLNLAPIPSGETVRNVRRSLEAPFNVAAVGVSLVDPDLDETRSVNMDAEHEVADPEARFKLEVRDILNELRDRVHRTNDRVEIQEEKSNRISDLDRRVALLDRAIVARDTAIHRVENDIITITRGVNNLSARVYEVHDKIMTNKEEIALNTEKIDIMSDEIIETQNLAKRNCEEIRELKQRNSVTGPTATPTQIKYTLPTFSALPSDKPIRFLRALINYLTAVSANAENFKYIIKQALRGSAYEWWENIEKSIVNIRGFREKFTAKYWSEGVQNKIRRELEFGFYKGEGHQTRSEYVVSLYNDVKQLSDVPATHLIVDKLSRHFDAVVQQTIITRRIKTIEELTELLDGLDQIGEVNSTFAMRQLQMTNPFMGGQLEYNRPPDPRNNSGIMNMRPPDFRASTSRPNMNNNRDINSNWREPRPYRANDSRNEQPSGQQRSTSREDQT